MSWLDTVIVVVSLALGLAGLWKGIFRTAFGIAGLVGGIYLAGRYAEPLASALFSSGATWTEVAAYAIILVSTVIVSSIIGWFTASLIHLTFLGWVDRLVGFILGAGIGAVLCTAVLAAAIKYLPATERAVSISPTAKLMLEYFPSLLALLPGEFDFARNFFA